MSRDDQDLDALLDMEGKHRMVGLPLPLWFHVEMSALLGIPMPPDPNPMPRFSWLPWRKRR